LEQSGAACARWASASTTSRTLICDFVRRFPHSRYCNRRIYEGERAEFERMGSTSMEPPAGLAVFVAVDQIFPG
jgi:hypothetical protein